MKYRKLWLVNSLGNRYELTDKNFKQMLAGIDGFGFKKKYTTQKVGNTEKLTSEEYELTDITGEMLFYSSDITEIYSDYQQFVQFCKYKPLELHYQTPNVFEEDSWHCQILFVSMGKTERDRDRVMHCPIVWHRLTEWLTDRDYYQEFKNDDLISKHYTLTRPYQYIGSHMQDAIVTNDGTDDVGFIITIDGYVINPYFTLSQNGTTYGICKLIGTFDKVIINSIEGNQSIYLERSGVELTNPEAYQDFTIADGIADLTFTKLKVGDTILNFTCSNSETFSGVVSITFKRSFVTA